MVVIEFQELHFVITFRTIQRIITERKDSRKGSRRLGGYKKIEESVVGGYKKIEESAVNGFTKMTDSFVDEFLIFTFLVS